MTTEAKQKCVCAPSTWASTPETICNEFAPSDMKREWCHNCGHDEDCHPTNTPKPITQ